MWNIPLGPGHGLTPTHHFLHPQITVCVDPSESCGYWKEEDKNDNDRNKKARNGAFGLLAWSPPIQGREEHIWALFQGLSQGQPQSPLPLDRAHGSSLPLLSTPRPRKTMPVSAEETKSWCVLEAGRWRWGGESSEVVSVTEPREAGEMQLCLHQGSVHTV